MDFLKSNPRAITREVINTHHMSFDTLLGAYEIWTWGRDTECLSNWTNDRQTSPMTLYWSMQSISSLETWLFTKAQGGEINPPCVHTEHEKFISDIRYQAMRPIIHKGISYLRTK